MGGINSGAEIVCHTDLSTCCGGFGYNDRGNWYFPNGDQLPSAFMDETAAPFVERRNIQRVELRRGSVSGDIPSGIYLCSIETVAVHSDDLSDTTTRESVYVGVYGSGGEHIIIIMGIRNNGRICLLAHRDFAYIVNISGRNIRLHVSVYHPLRPMYRLIYNLCVIITRSS